MVTIIVILRCQYAEDLFVPGMENTVESLAASDRHLVYGAACYRHGVLMSPQWRQLRLEGVSPEEQLLAWLEHDTRTQVSHQNHHSYH